MTGEQVTTESLTTRVKYHFLVIDQGIVHLHLIQIHPTMLPVNHTRCLNYYHAIPVGMLAAADI